MKKDKEMEYLLLGKCWNLLDYTAEIYSVDIPNLRYTKFGREFSIVLHS